jgi:hypothetical protein
MTPSSNQPDKSNGFKFESRITLGNIIEIITLLTVIVMSYANLKGSQEIIRVQLERQTADVNEIKQQYLRADIQQTRQEIITSELKFLNQRLDRIEKALK